MPENIKNLGSTITAFITILLGLIFIGVIADNSNPITETASATNESVTALNNTNTTLTNDDLFGTLTVKNATTTLGSGNYTVYLTDGKIHWVLDNTTVWTWNNTALNVSYEFYPDDYVQDGTSRTFVRLIPLFFALFIVIVGVVYFYKMGEGVLFK